MTLTIFFSVGAAPVEDIGAVKDALALPAMVVG
jgi:hypothetical protein